MIDGLSEYGRLRQVLMKHARDAFVSDGYTASQWKELNYSAQPDVARAIAEYETFQSIVAGSGAGIITLPPDEALTLDSIYTRDASILTPAGMVLCRMGKKARADEPGAQQREFRRQGFVVAGSIVPPGQLEGGDMIWLENRTLVVGLGARTNREGVRQLEAMLGDSVDHVIIVPLPDYTGQHDVMHLMSLISPVDVDLAVIYPRLLPDVLRQPLSDRGYRFVEVPDEEFESMGTNVLALGPRDCLMLDGNPQTRAALERAGARVQVYEGIEISLKGGGGPTCLTRPLQRE